MESLKRYSNVHRKSESAWLGLPHTRPDLLHGIHTAAQYGSSQRNLRVCPPSHWYAYTLDLRLVGLDQFHLLEALTEEAVEVFAGPGVMREGWSCTPVVNSFAICSYILDRSRCSCALWREHLVDRGLGPYNAAFSPPVPRCLTHVHRPGRNWRTHRVHCLLSSWATYALNVSGY